MTRPDPRDPVDESSGDPPASRLLAYGDCGVLVTARDLADALHLGAVLRAAHGDGRLPGAVDLVPAARSVLVVAEAPPLQGQVATALRAALARAETVPAEGPADRATADAADEVEIPVRYDGPDLSEVGRLTGLGPDGVVDAHLSTAWVVGFAGFAPGFAYLVDSERGARSPLFVRRRGDPRTRVPAGSVGLAGEFSGVYPSASPGGWQLIGATSTAMWDVGREPAALLRPGDRVRFVRATADR